MYEAIFLPQGSLERGDTPFGVPTLGALIDILVERRAVHERAPVLVIGETQEDHERTA